MWMEAFSSGFSKSLVGLYFTQFAGYSIYPEPAVFRNASSFFQIMNDPANSGFRYRLDSGFFTGSGKYWSDSCFIYSCMNGAVFNDKFGDKGIDSSFSVVLGNSIAGRQDR
jgi:hypothetical protein